MRKIIFLFMISLLILIAGCTHKAQWNQFTWVEYSFGDQHYDKAAVFIPLKFSGSDEEYYVQLDTGASSVLNGNSFSDINKTVYGEEQTPSVVSLNGVLSNYRFKNKEFRIKQNYGPTLEELHKAKYKKVGNLGLDFFKDSILVLDFPQQRFMIAKSRREMPEYILARTAFFDINVRKGKLYLDSKIGDKDLTLFYDTGASFFSIITTKDTWFELTDTKREEAEILLNVPSWGKRAQLKGERAKNDWIIGGLTIEKPIVFYETTGLENFNFKAIKADGLFGNIIFYNSFIITLDLKNNKFGIMEVEK